ncbi:unnamed protein product [Rangifer tarandus platyrhynchus]|uniref:Uncharacterized protein n=2 Tax=Rangifer tarandus platyrhynchus TaxID=3082113 RepID=A0ACB0E6Q5_RANTA|nr:unnamed protein product [Rangifer tarandus platyrhynchus]CAI9696215.1 unnamed protein product [Rangifer tarandus platyrhynchus]
MPATKGAFQLSLVNVRSFDGLRGRGSQVSVKVSMNDPRLEPGEGPRTRACDQSHCGKESPEPLGVSGLAVGV